MGGYNKKVVTYMRIRESYKLGTSCGKEMVNRSLL